MVRTGSPFPVTLRLFKPICKRWLVRLEPWLDFSPKIALQSAL
jgi:hypothetical protein